MLACLCLRMRGIERRLTCNSVRGSAAAGRATASRLLSPNFAPTRRRYTFARKKHASPAGATHFTQKLLAIGARLAWSVGWIGGGGDLARIVDEPQGYGRRILGVQRRKIRRH